MASYIDDLRLAHLLADNADSITESRFKAQDLKVESKPDHTAVTDADRAVEEALRKLLATSRPRDAVLGEELPDTGYGPRQWIIDPIDGTANYVRGVPVWATLIGLMIDGVVRVGVVSAPLLGRRWWAAEGDGAFAGKSILKAERIHTSAVRKVSDAFVSYSSLGGWITSGRGQGFVDLLRDAHRTRGFGDFWSYMLVAEGVVDAAAEPELSLWDKAALDVIVREAGGRFTDLDGNDGSYGPGAIGSNGPLHDELVERLALVQETYEETTGIIMPLPDR
ncbi:inositol monophosphatase family protein [Propionimicrobium sp. PCR01-08-3]|uniref:inositol monophosphatase family protein n=1 Tax=Propionimicrobium sp. PCR01-08-3 TaxID=3052086 RepID=UPI00255CE62F|nr:inositol monophosphatase family protein [Propionimicrobium sp. PCR01-08-3]WIY83796.1 inositol monophosphatase family protein [Propionimicrobium sp. PCR01-08-3]